MNFVFVYFAMAFLTPAEQPREERIQELVREIANSGSMLEAGDRQTRLADPRLTLAPGVPPLLSFRYFQGADHGRFGKLDLMLDDAGH